MQAYRPLSPIWGYQSIFCCLIAIQVRLGSLMVGVTIHIRGEFLAMVAISQVDSLMEEKKI